MPTKTPCVSVIVPVYNVEQYVERCLDSLVNQTLKNIEIIVIDDCSTDTSLDIIRKIAKKDKRIHVIALKQNSGVAVARNKGMEIATGEYIGFVDPDDYVDKDFFKILYENAKLINADISKGRLLTKYPDGSVLEAVNNNDVKNQYCFHINFTSAIYKNSMLKDNGIVFPENVSLGEDCTFLGKSICCSKKFIKNDKVSYWYIRHDDSASSTIKELSSVAVDNALKAYKQLIVWSKSKKGMSDDAQAYISYHAFILVEWLHGYNISLKDKEKASEILVWIYNNALNISSIIKNKHHNIISALKNNAAHKVNLILSSRHKRGYLFGWIPVIKILYLDGIYISYNLFDYIPIFKITKEHRKTKYYVCGILVYKIKE